MTGDQLYDLASSVASRQEFLAFVDLLEKNYAGHRHEWENDSLPGFLKGLGGFAADMSGYYRNVGETIDVNIPTWRMIAQMLLAARIYGA